MTIREKTAELESVIAEIEAINTALFARDTVGESISPAELLAVMLAAMRRFGELRQLTQKAEKLGGELVESLSPRATVNNYWRSLSSGFNNSCDSINTIWPKLESELPDPRDIVTISPVLKRLSAALQQSNAIWRNNYRPTVKRLGIGNTDWYSEHKRELPYGAREALSVIECWDRNAIQTSYSAQLHDVFGMQFELSEVQLRSIRQVERKLRIARQRGVRELKGPFPSWKRGRHILRHYRYYNHPDNSRSVRTRRTILAAIRRRGIGRVDLLGLPAAQRPQANNHGPNSLLNSVTMFRMATESDSARAHRVGMRWIQKTINPRVSCNPTAIITGSPQRIRDQFYFIPAAWLDDGRMVHSLLILHTGWSDCYHVSPNELAKINGGEVELSEAVTKLESRIGQQMRWQESARRSAEEQKKKYRSTIARITWALRQFDKRGVTLRKQDSYAVGNCRPGTAEFCRAVGMDNEREAQPRKLWRRWKDANYRDVQLFGMTVQNVARRVGVNA